MSARNTKSAQASTACPCGSGRTYRQCCQPLHEGAAASDAEALMRSRYCAYALHLDDYLLRSWHASTRPANLASDDGTRWIGLQVRHHRPLGADEAEVAFVARYKIGGRAYRLQETSRFMRENGHWFYVDGVHGDGDHSP